MRTGISIAVSAADRRRLEAIVSDRNAAQKHVWRARITLLTAEGLGTHTIMAATGKSKTTVWRWQERFAEAGIAGLLCDKTRPPGKGKISAGRTAEVVRVTQAPLPHEATHWTARAMAKAVGLGVATVQRIWAAHGLSPHRWRVFKLSKTPHSSRSCMTSSAYMLNRQPMPWCSASMRSPGSRRSIAPNRDCR
jgi:transposase